MSGTIVITTSGRLYSSHDIFNPYTFRLIEDEYGRAAVRITYHHIIIEQIVAVL